MFVVPASSLAILTTVVVPTAKLDPLAGTLTTLTPGQLSVASTLNTTLRVHGWESEVCVRLAGHVITGGCVSLTVTVKLQMLVLPAASLAVLTTVVVPTAKLDPLAGTLTTLTPGQLSVAPTISTAHVWNPPT